MARWYVRDDYPQPRLTEPEPRDYEADALLRDAEQERREDMAREDWGGDGSVTHLGRES